MLKAKDKEARRGNLITFAIVLVLTLVTMVLENVMSPGSLLFTVIKKGAVYSLVAVSMNLLNGFTGLFSLGQAGFMLLGAYAYAIFMIPDAARDGVYYLFEGSSVHFSFQEMFQHLFGATGFGGGVSLVLGVIVAIIFAGLVAAFFAYLIGLPVLRLKSDYLAIATLGFAEILRAIFQWQTLGKVTNGANILKGYPTFADFNITNASGKVLFRLSAVVPILLAGICIFLIVLLINSSYGRVFKAIRDDEIAAEAMGVNLAKHKSLSFVISSFFAGVSGALFAMFATTVQAKVFTSAMTYEILLIVVIGGIGSVSGSCIASFLYIACSEWWLRFLDNEAYIGAFKVPLLRNGFRMVVFSVIIMIVVLFFRKGIIRTFQNIRLWKSMTVFENVLVAKHMRAKQNVFSATFRGNAKEEKRMRDETMALLVEQGLEKYKDDIATSLPYGIQRRLEIARALATDPKLLLLDEPAAGMNPQETLELAAFIHELRDKYGLTIFLIEHHMDLVMRISDYIYVIDFGSKIAEGIPQEIQNNQHVIDAYLGVVEDE